jgi:putative hemolysin
MADMQEIGSPPPLNDVPLLPAPLRAWAAPAEAALRRWVLPPDLMASLERAQDSGRGAAFARNLLEALQIRFEVERADLARIPRQGAALVVANHPFGIVEGLIVPVLLGSVRDDYRIVANSILASLGGLRDVLVPVNPFETTQAHVENRRPLRACLEWLSRAGLLAMFPAGEVAHLDWMEHSITDPPWKTTAARFALRAQCPVIPVFFEGANSLSFQLTGTIHPRLRTMGLAREFRKLRGRTIPVRIGSPIPYSVLKAYGEPDRATEYLRSRTFFLSHRLSATSGNAVRPVPDPQPPAPDLGSPTRRLLSDEVAALPPECELIRNGDFTVYLAGALQIPRLLLEIGRRRELAFRLVGEGTGRQIDLDWFDDHYYHLFLWNRADDRLAGAYRLALTSEVLERFGIRGLYTSTLFRYQPQFFERIGPAVELGRSFVSPEYQKSYSPLLLLWKGITRFIQQRPEAAVLFGAVSISRDYRAASRGLMATYLSARATHDLARLVAPRLRFRAPGSTSIRRLASVAANIEDISLSISDIEADGKGIPVLIRQYLKAGGKLLALNVDPNFSDALDALLLADLRTAPPAILERCLGRADAKAFIASLQSIQRTGLAAERPQ